MAICKECIHFPVCEPHTDSNESYPEVGGCPAFKNKDAFVEVVRCKDCKHFVQSEPYDPCECMKWTVKWGVAYVNPDDFCSYGERREGKDD